jgi:hypothetical protein
MPGLAYGIYITASIQPGNNKKTKQPSAPAVSVLMSVYHIGKGRKQYLIINTVFSIPLSSPPECLYIRRRKKAGTLSGRNTAGSAFPIVGSMVRSVTGRVYKEGQLEHERLHSRCFQVWSNSIKFRATVEKNSFLHFYRIVA